MLWFDFLHYSPTAHQSYSYTTDLLLVLFSLFHLFGINLLNYMGSISSSALLSWCWVDWPRLCGAVLHVIIHLLPRNNQSFDLLRFVTFIDVGRWLREYANACNVRTHRLQVIRFVVFSCFLVDLNWFVVHSALHYPSNCMSVPRTFVEMKKSVSALCVESCMFRVNTIVWMLGVSNGRNRITLILHRKMSTLEY